MPDDLSKRGRADAKRISLTEEWEMRYWCDRLGCTEQVLRATVEEVGHMVKDVERKLER